MTQNQEILAINADYLHNARQVFNNLDVRESTRQDYQYRIGLFVSYVLEHGLSQNTFLEFKRYLAARGDYSVSTKNKYLVTAKIFLKELHRNNRIPNITENVKTFSHSKKHKKDGLSENDIRQIIAYLHKLPQNADTARLKAVLSLLILQGTRLVELSRLDVADIDLVSNTALVRGKGQDDSEIIYLHPETTKALSLYMKTNQVSSGPLFTSNSNSSRHHRLTTRGLRRLVKDLFAKAGVDKHVHGCRHYFVTTLVNSYKGDLLRVAKYSRHRSLEMLTIYHDTILTKADLPKFYDTFGAIRIN